MRRKKEKETNKRTDIESDKETEKEINNLNLTTFPIV
jgi:hypothetical protein